MRDLLNRAERQLPVLDSSNLVEYLRSLDRVEYLMESLTSDSVDLRPEMTRWLDLQAAPRGTGYTTGEDRTPAWRVCGVACGQPTGCRLVVAAG